MTQPILLTALTIYTDRGGFLIQHPDVHPLKGKYVWNADDGALNIGMPGGNVIAQVPLESLVRVTNKSGSGIVNGDLVYVDGSQGNRDTVAVSDNTDVNTIFVLGMATEDIDNNNNGYVARFGYVKRECI